MTTKTKEETPPHLKHMTGEELKAVEAIGDPLVGLLKAHKAHPVQMSMDLLTYIAASLWVDVRMKNNADRMDAFDKWVECVRRTVVDTRADMQEAGDEGQD